VVKHRNVIAPGMFKVNPSQTSRVDLVPDKQFSASIRTNPITNFQCHVTFKENVSSDTVNASSTGLVHTDRTKRPRPKGNTRNARVPSTSKSSEVKKNVTVEDHHRTLLLSKNQKTMSSKCNNIKLAIRNDKFKSVCGLDNTKTRRPQPRSNTKNDRVLFASKSSRSKNKEVKVEEHHRNLLLSKKNKHISSACNNSKIDSQNAMSKVVCVVNQSPSGLFINQSNYVNEILKKYRLNTCDIIGTPMDIKDKLDLDQIRTLVDATK
nr:hypothetical protein [Tanacetum cinerariifolium]